MRRMIPMMVGMMLFAPLMLLQAQEAKSPFKYKDAAPKKHEI